MEATPGASSLADAVETLSNALWSYVEDQLAVKHGEVLVELAQSESDAAQRVFYATMSGRDGRAARAALSNNEKQLRAKKKALETAIGSHQRLIRAWLEVETAFLVAEQDELNEFDRSVSERLTVGESTLTMTGLAADEGGTEEAFATKAAFVVEIGMRPAGAEELIKRLVHVGPQQVLGGISLDQAIDLKKTFEELLGARVRITEGVARNAREGRRPIPEHVRHEVWRRDGGQCVDCGSRERLELDHIVPLSKGGSNSVRNIELRCESCNRRKADTI